MIKKIWGEIVSNAERLALPILALSLGIFVLLGRASLAGDGFRLAFISVGALAMSLYAVFPAVTLAVMARVT